MSPRDLAFLLITIVRFATTSNNRLHRLLIVRSLESTRSLEDIPDRWRTVNPEFKAPQIEIQLMKDHVSPGESWIFINKYKYSSKDYYGATKATLTKDEKKVPRIENGDMEKREKEEENDVEDDIVMPDMLIPQIGSRNIITLPIQCPDGQRQDRRGRCRDIIL